MKLKEQIEQLDGVISVKEKKGKLVVKYQQVTELIDGDIYYGEDRVLRYNGVNMIEGINVYSQLTNDGEYYQNTRSLGYHNYAKCLTNPTTEQKQKLIKAEVEHGFFWEIERGEK